MSNALQVLDLIKYGVNPACQAAFPGVPITDEEGAQTYQGAPLLTVEWLPVDIAMGGYNAAVNETNQAYKFRITYFFNKPKPSNDLTKLLTIQKATYASALIAQLQTGPGFAQVGSAFIANMPIVEKVDPMPKNIPSWEGAAAVQIIFCCQAAADHH